MTTVSLATEKKLRDAMQRLLAGKSKRTDGRLTKANLHIEAGVSRATMNRPFTRVRKMEVAAQDRYRSKIKELESSLQETQNRVNELQKTKENGQKFILSPEQQAELAKFQEKQVQVRKELKDVRKDLHREIDSLENRLKWINIAGMPLVVTIAGVSLALLKRRKTAAK